MRAHLSHLCLLLAVFCGARVWGQSLPPIRIGDHPGFARVVLDLPEKASFAIEPLGAALRVTLHQLQVVPEIRFVNLPELAGYVLEQHEDKAVLLLLTPQGATPRSGYRTMTLAALQGDGQRLVIDLSGAFVDTRPLPVFPEFRFVKAGGRRFSVVVDAGHGGPDPGALGYVVEKVVNLEVALRVRRWLQAAGVEVTLTREQDTALAPDKRTDLAQRVALAEGKDLLVSIHANAAVPARADGWCGLEVYYFGTGPTRPFFPSPAPLAPMLPAAMAPDPLEVLVPLAPPNPFDPEASPDLEPIPPQGLPTPQMNSLRRMELSRTLATRVLSYMLGTTAAFNRGVRSADFFVIRYASVPAILVEVGYLSHPIEGQNLRDTNYLDRISYGIARGVLEYLEHDQPLE